MARADRRAIRVALVALAILLVGAVAAPWAAAWQAAPGPAVVPFGVGERSEYQVKLGAVTVGSGAMEVLETEQVNGHPTYHARLRLSGGLPFARVDDRFDSWIDVGGLFSRRFKQNQRELSFRRNRTYDFFPESFTYRRLDNGEVGRIPTNRPLDEVSFLYYARTLPLRVGEEYRLNQYYKEDGNPVVLRVLRKERVRVPAGTFETIVVRPIIKTDGLFGEGGEAEVYFTDDQRRVMVLLRSNVPRFPGSLTMHMTSYRAGHPISGGPATQ